MNPDRTHPNRSLEILDETDNGRPQAERRQSSRAAAVEAKAKTKAALERAAKAPSDDEEYEGVIEINSDDEAGDAARSVLSGYS